jgi:hypothetical protein
MGYETLVCSKNAGDAFGGDCALRPMGLIVRWNQRSISDLVVRTGQAWPQDRLNRSVQAGA